MYRTKSLHLDRMQRCYYCSENTEDFGLVANDDFEVSMPLIFAICRSCAIESGLASDDEEWEDDLQVGRPRRSLLSNVRQFLRRVSVW